MSVRSPGSIRHPTAGAVTPVPRTSVPAPEAAGAAVESLAPAALYLQVAEKLRGLIFNHVLAPGSWIDEQALAGQYGISRTPLREALKVLATEGLVVLKPRRGCYVAEPDERDLDEIFTILAELEGRAAADATRAALIAYSGGLLGLILVKVLAPAFYARQDIRTPVKIAVVTLLVTQVMNFAFVGPFKHAGLALATGLGSCLNAALLYYLLHKRGIHRPQPGWLMFLCKLMFAVALMAGVVWFAAGDAQRWFAASGWVRVAWLLAVVSLGAAVYFAALWLLGFRVRHFARFESK